MKKSGKEEKELFAKLEKRRMELRNDQSIIELKDLGAGSETLKSNRRTVSSIANTSLKSPKYARLLYQIAKHYGAKRMVELGTSLGITTTYLASTNEKSHVYSFEGISAIADVAAETILKANLTNITLKRGNFDETLPIFVEKEQVPFDLLFIDGNHREEPVIRYFNLLLPVSQPHSIFIFDDIHWSAEMESAWDKLKSHPAVMGSIDLFFMGIILLSPHFKEPVHLKIRY